MADLRALLPRTWYAFLARHPRPRPIQELAIPWILEGAPVLLASATATGKTEAYAAPLAERWLEDLRAGRRRVLVVSPTRALVNDLARRLEAPMARCGVRVDRRTGDHARSPEDLKGGVLLTTPESWDSLLARHARHLGEIRAVVLDELHVLEGSPRGDQVRVLLERLDRVVAALGGPPPQRLAATATLARAEEVAGLFLRPAARVARTAEQRELTLELAESRSAEESLGAIEAACRQMGARKALVFVPSRAEAELLGAGFLGRPPFHSHVYVHHASLSRPERERVERQFLRAPAALCLATPTLELGVDIGDVDLVVLSGPPPDVPSFLQRVGRGNRRSGRCQVLGLHQGPGQRLRFLHLLECARQGRLLVPGYPFRASVLVQQCFSLAFQSPRRQITAEALAGRLPGEVRQGFPAVRLEELLDHLAERGWLTPAGGGRYAPSDRLHRLFELGRLHDNLEQAREERQAVDVVDEHTGRVIGRVLRDEEGRLPREVALGGRSRRLVADHGRLARARSSGQGARGSFRSRGSAPVPLLLAQDLARFLGFTPGEAALARADGRMVVGHFLGTAGGRLLREFLEDQWPGAGAGSDGLVAWVEGEGWPDITAPAVETLLARRCRRLARALGAGPWARELPTPWLVEELRGLARAQGLVEHLCALRPRPAGPEEAALLVSLLPSRIFSGGAGRDG